MPRASSWIAVSLLVLGLLPVSACRSRPRTPVAQPPAAPAVASQEPADGPARLRLRYYDLKDLETKNGILVVRGTPEALKAIDQHLSAIRALRTASDALAAKQAAERALHPPKPEPTRGYVVQIHAVNDLVQGMTSEALLASVKAGVGEAVWAQLTVRLQGTSALIVKGPRASHERVAEVLDGLRAAK